MIYTITNHSYEVGSWGSTDSTIIATTDKQIALERFSELEFFCNKTRSDQKWWREYQLLEWYREDSFRVLKICDNDDNTGNKK